MWATKPTVLIETGTGGGGATRFFANIFDLLGEGRVISIDNREERRPAHPRITYLLGDSASVEIAEAARSLIRPDDRVMVDLDSDHSAQHVLAELEIYSPLVTIGCYLIIEDTNIPGLGAAVDEFLKTHDDFRRISGERMFLTFNPGGYLIREKGIF